TINRIFMKKLDIHAVHDEKIILDSIKIQIEKNFSHKYIFDYADNPQEALEVIDELMHEDISLLLVISDYMMPGMNGEEFANTLKSKMKNVNILMLTGHMSEDKGLDLIEKNIVLKVMQKPWKEESLIEFINKLSENA
ncbi:MAG: response regulator, partial [Bacteroidota bacterium]